MSTGTGVKNHSEILLDIQLDCRQQEENHTHTIHAHKKRVENRSSLITHSTTMDLKNIQGYERGEKMLYSYVVRYLNQSLEVECSEDPNAFLALTEKFYRLFTLNTLRGYQVWQDNGVLIPLHGADSEQTLLLPDLMEDQEADDDLKYSVGNHLIQGFIHWNNELRTIQAHLARRATDAERSGTLTERVQRIEEAFVELQAGPLSGIPVTKMMDTWRGGGGASIEIIGDKLHISRATLYRYRRRIAESLGDWALRSLPSNTLKELLDTQN